VLTKRSGICFIRHFTTEDKIHMVQIQDRLHELLNEQTPPPSLLAQRRRELMEYSHNMLKAARLPATYKVRLTKHLFVELRLPRTAPIELSTVESCSGGFLSGSFVAHPHCSTYIKVNRIVYDPQDKKDELHLDSSLFEDGGPGQVSEPCARQMAEAGRTMSRMPSCTVGISITGVAGPSGLEGHPVGVAYVGMAIKGKTWARKVDLTDRSDYQNQDEQIARENLMWAFAYEAQRETARHLLTLVPKTEGKTPDETKCSTPAEQYSIMEQLVGWVIGRLGLMPEEIK
jgi:PncC family amidohydrolase